MSATNFGQVTETYRFGNELWVTIWDLEHKEQRAARNAASPPVTTGSYVEFVLKKGKPVRVRLAAESLIPKELLKNRVF
jgi:hypothetical protein